MIRLFFKTAFKSLYYYKGANFILFLACLIACAVIMGAFVSQTSLESSLVNRVNDAFGKGDYFASSPSSNLKSDFFTDASLVLQKKGAIVFDAKSSAVDIFGIDGNFSKFAPQEAQSFSLKDSEIAINLNLAKSLNLKLGDEATLILLNSNSEPLDFTFASNEKSKLLKNFKVVKILADSEFGNLSFSPTQSASKNVFISLENLKNLTNSTGANFAILKNPKINLKGNLDIKDFNCVLDGGKILKSKSWFLPDFFSDENFGKILSPKLSWFISDFSVKTKTANFGFALADESISSGNVEINSELAKELSAKLEDEIVLGFYVSDELGKFEFKKKNFRISKIFDMAYSQNLKPFIPDFKGLTDADSCGDWKSKMPIDFESVKESDKIYWKEYSYAPKILLSLTDAQNIFLNSKKLSSALVINDNDKFNKKFQDLTPKDLGVTIEQLKNKALQNARNGVDFSGLFIGLSFFIIVSAMLLIKTAILLSLNSRRAEIEEFVRLGFRESEILKIYFFEFLITSLNGVFWGIFLGLAYGALITSALNTVWAGITVGADIAFKFDLSDVVYAVSISGVTVLISIYWSLKNLMNLSRPKNDAKSSKKSIISFALSLLFLAFIFALFKSLKEPQLVEKSLFSILAFVSSLICLWNGFSLCNFNLKGVFLTSLLSASRRKSKLSSVFIMSAIGLYLLMIVGLNKFSAGDLSSKSSASGGYKYFIETAIAASDISKNQSIDILEAKVFDAAQANCLNLNKVTNPRVLGLDFKKLHERNSFTFDGYLDGFNTSSWNILGQNLGSNEIPAVIDSASLMWSIKGKIGDVLEYRYGGKLWRFKIVATLAPSIFQGSLIISSKNFADVFSGIDGCNLFLVENVPTRILDGIFSDYYPSITTCQKRMDAFNELQNSYLQIFLQLGILGVALGFFACAILSIGDAKKSQKELNLLIACGWRYSDTANFISFQYVFLIFLSAISAVIGASFIIDVVANLFAILAIVLFSLLFMFLISNIFFFINFREFKLSESA